MSMFPHIYSMDNYNMVGAKVLVPAYHVGTGLVQVLLTSYGLQYDSESYPEWFCIHLWIHQEVYFLKDL